MEAEGQGTLMAQQGAIHLSETQLLLRLAEQEAVREILKLAADKADKPVFQQEIQNSLVVMEATHAAVVAEVLLDQQRRVLTEETESTQVIQAALVAVALMEVLRVEMVKAVEQQAVVVLAQIAVVAAAMAALVIQM